jgi:hypothetical protein
MGLVVMKADNPVPPLKKKKLNWLGHDVEAMRRAVEMCNLNHVPQAVRKVIETEAWREFWLNMKLYEFKSFRELITTSKHEGGCGWEPKYVEALVKKSGDVDALRMYRAAITRKPGGDQKSEQAKINSDNVTIEPKRGNDLAYTLDRLKREDKELFDRVCAGELSANAAAIKAGFRKKPTSLDQLLNIACRLSTSERLAAIEYLTHLIRLDIGPEAASDQINCVVHDILHGNPPTPALLQKIVKSKYRIPRAAVPTITRG